MASQPNRRRRPISQPGQIGGMSRDELRNLLLQEDIEESPAAPEYVMKEVKAVQESGHSGSPNMNITEPEGGKESNPSSPVSEYGQKGRNHYKNSGSNPVSDENFPGQISEKTQNELICLDGPGDTHESKEEGVDSKLETHLQRQRKMPPNQSKSPPMTTNLLQPQKAYDPHEQALRTAKDPELTRSSEDSFVIPSSEISSANSFKDMLTTCMGHSSVRDSSKHSEGIEELVDYRASHPSSLQTKLPIPSQVNYQSESIKAMLLSLIRKVNKQDPDTIDTSCPSLRSYFLFLSLNSGKNPSLDQMTRQLSSLVSPDNEMCAILRAECCEPHCSKAHCQEVQQRVRNLQDFDVPLTDLTKEEQMLLLHMHNHCQSCQYLHCPLYWCQKEAFIGMNDVQEILAKMKQLLEHGYHGGFLDDLKKETVLPFLQGPPLTSIPRESEEWSGLFRLPGASNTIFAQSAMEEERGYWILKKCRMFKSHSQMKLYETLKRISSKGIAQHLWTAFCPVSSFMSVCMRFEAYSLYDRLQESPIKKIRIVVRIMLQLIHTTKRLHEMGILYLNWSSKNIVFSSPEHIKLTNFTCSALKSKIDEDIADVFLSLPRHLIAPEMLETKPEADEKTDIWGLACLLKEILSGQPVWYELIHEPDSVLHEKMMENDPPKPHDCLELFLTFKACWERPRSIRPSLEELEIYLAQADDRQKYK